MISSAGSTAAGRKVAGTAGKMLEKVALEPGGNDAAIVIGDAGLGAVTSPPAFGQFLHQDRICVAIGRHRVQGSVARACGESLAMREEPPRGRPGPRPGASGASSSTSARRPTPRT